MKNKIDTSIDGFRYVGINLTEEQFEDLQTLNLLMQTKDRKKIPVFDIMLMLKIMGLLNPEVVNDCGGNDSDCDTNDNVNDSFQRKFGRII